MHTYHMPVKCFVGETPAFADEFAGYGPAALVVTGKSSAKNGSLADVSEILRSLGVRFSVFNSVEENPSVETVERAAKEAAAENLSFVVGLGGGSPMDVAKAVAVLAATPGLSGHALFTPEPLPALPVLLVPTTAGSGSETTPYAVLTDHTRRTKSSIARPVFAEKAFLDSRYMAALPESAALSAAVDALTHLIEGYTSAAANFFSNSLATSGLTAFGRCIPGLAARAFTPALRETLLLVSAQAGMVIAQTKTSLPHLLGYALTYEKSIPHGFACGMLTVPYLKLYENKARVADILRFLGFGGLDELGAFLRGVSVRPPFLTDDEAAAYAGAAFAGKARLKSYPFPLTENDLAAMYGGLRSAKR